MIEVEPQQTEWGDEEVQQRIEILSEVITDIDPDEHNEPGTYDIMETFAQHHNLDFKQAVPVQLSICNVTGKIGLNPMDALFNKYQSQVHKIDQTSGGGTGKFVS